VINWADEPQEYALVLNEELLAQAPIPASRRLLVWEYFERRFVGSYAWGEALPPISVPAHGTRMLRIAPWDGSSAVLAGTDRHLSMGGVEVTGWESTSAGIEVAVESPWPEPWSIWIARAAPDTRAGVSISKHRISDAARRIRVDVE
jgi:hypothetical protein